MEHKDKSNIYLSIFKRKGGEGIYTKINEQIESFLVEKDRLEGEKLLLSSKRNDEDVIVLLTNMRLIIIDKTNNILQSNYSNITDVKPAIQEEYNDGNKNPVNFSKIKIFMEDESNLILKVESGEPYNGIFQMLHYISTQNNG